MGGGIPLKPGGAPTSKGRALSGQGWARRGGPGDLPAADAAARALRGGGDAAAGRGGKSKEAEACWSESVFFGPDPCFCFVAIFENGLMHVG